MLERTLMHDGELVEVIDLIALCLELRTQQKITSEVYIL